MIKLCMALTACFMLFTTGCSTAADAEAYSAEPVRHVSSTVAEVTVEQIINEYNSSRKAVALPVEEDDVYAPLAVARCVCRIGDSYIVFPKVEGESGETINSAICSAVAGRAEYLGFPVFADYRVEYNRNGIFSIRMFLYDMYGEGDVCIDCIPLTFNSETGGLYRISDFFDSENQNWRGRIPDIITAQAADCQMVLLSDIMPIADDRPFYITDEAVVIMYDLYEISTYEAGEPEFEIAVDDIAECLDDTSVLNVMLPQPEEQIQPAEGELLPEETLEQQPEQTEDTENTENPENTEDPEDTDNTDNTENTEGADPEGATEELPEDNLQQETEQGEDAPAVISEQEETAQTEELQ